MSKIISSVFDDFPEEANYLARILAGYGELEWEFTMCLGAVLGDNEQALRALFRMRSERYRVEVGDALMRSAYTEAKLTPPYTRAIGQIRWCMTLRNQYAHCHWVRDKFKLQILNLEDIAKSQESGAKADLRGVRGVLLKQQAEYFGNTELLLIYLSDEYKKRIGKIESHDHEVPPSLKKPKLFGP